MGIRKSGLLLTTSLLLLCALSARAEVLNAAPNGFTVRHEVAIEADRLTVYAAAVGSVGQWWSSDHTVSGDAANLSITPTVPGCFCESLGPDAGLVHMTVSFINPGVMIRLTGGLGPLQEMGIDGALTIRLQEAADDQTGLTLVYAVSGFDPNGLDRIAPAVDRVLTQQMGRLKSWCETSAP